MSDLTLTFFGTLQAGEVAMSEENDVLLKGCLAEDTQVMRLLGMYRPIQHIRSGERIVSGDGKGDDTVVDTWQGRETMLLKITFDGNKTIKMTTEHPVLTPDGYVKAESLKAGSVICGSDGYNKRAYTVTAIEREEGQFTVYNLDTQNNSPFIAEGVVVGTFRTQNTI